MLFSHSIQVESAEHSTTKMQPTTGSMVASNNGDTAAAAAVTQQKSTGRVSSASRFAGYTIRTVLLDLPVLVICATYVAIVWTHRVHDLYLSPQIENAWFDPERYNDEWTYYDRPCTAEDITAKEGKPLVLREDATPQDAYEHQMLHGFTVFQNVLTPATTKALRDYIAPRNRNLTPLESIYVIENDNRYSFGLSTEEPTVAKAMQEIAHHHQLRPALEVILGPNPSMIEMTAITIGHGAINQWWHDDVIADGSVLRFGRTFGPSYSVFIQLQNATAAMGSTSICPGSHYCSSEHKLDDVCQAEGFQFAGADGKAWGAGDALLMNMNSYHRGSAHTDPDAPDRVMLILTFAPRPGPHAETRQMSQGITFSLRFDMWGHCLNDLATAAKTMRHPWALLRSLGLYKGRNADWGVDYISGAIMRMGNEDEGFTPEELDTFIELDGLKWIPKFLYADVDSTSTPELFTVWQDFYFKTMVNCEEFVLRIASGVLAAYLFIFLVLGLIAPHSNRLGRFKGAVYRLTMIAAMLGTMYYMANRHVDNTNWAKDSVQNLRYATGMNVENDKEFGIVAAGPSTKPTRNDVLIETRYGSPYLHMYNDYISFHPGNRLLRSYVSHGKRLYPSYSDLFQEAQARYIVSVVGSQHGRFLYQGPGGYWTLMDDEAAITYVRTELAVNSHPLTKELMQSLRFLSSECRFGHLRNSVLSRKHTVPYLTLLRQKILANTEGPSTTPANNATVPHSKAALGLQRKSLIQSFTPRANRVPRPIKIHVGPKPTEPKFGRWLKSGDKVLGVWDGYWYLGRIISVNPHGEYKVEYLDGDVSTHSVNELRPFVPYVDGESVEVMQGDDGAFFPARVVARMEDGTYHVVMSASGEYAEGVKPEYISQSQQVNTRQTFR